MTTYLNSLCFVNFMANRMQLLDARLQRVDARTQTIFEASAAQRAVVQPAEEWWPSLVQMFGTQDAMFQRLGIEGCFLTKRWLWCGMSLPLIGGGGLGSEQTGRGCSV